MQLSNMGWKIFERKSSHLAYSAVRDKLKIDIYNKSILNSCLPNMIRNNCASTRLAYSRDFLYKGTGNTVIFADNKNYLVSTVPYLQTL